MWSAREAFARKRRLIQTAYPRCPDWTLEDHADAVGNLLDVLHLPQVHLLAESFGSLVGIEFALRNPDRVGSIAILGGFCSSPAPLRAWLARRLFKHAPTWVLDRSVGAYAWWITRGRGKGRRLAIREDVFFITRTRLGWQSLANRMRLIYSTDLRKRLAKLDRPVCYIGGERDWIVPVRREIRCFQSMLSSQCGFCSWLIPHAPHPILPCRPRDCAKIVIGWIDSIEQRQ